MSREDFDFIINFLSNLFLVVIGVLVSFGMFYIFLNNIEKSVEERAIKYYDEMCVEDVSNYILREDNKVNFCTERGIIKIYVDDVSYNQILNNEKTPEEVYKQMQEKGYNGYNVTLRKKDK